MGTNNINKKSTEWAREVIANYNSSATEYTIVASDEKIAEWYRSLEKNAPATVEYDEQGNLLVPERLYYHFSKFSGGALLMISNQQPSAEAQELQKRAASVFELAYTRFLDLQKAEANAREAVKQSSLDRIRADIASMRTTDDLGRITPLIWNELTILGVPFIRCGVFIMDEAQKTIHTFLSTPDGKAITAFDMPFTIGGNISQVLSHWQQRKVYMEHWGEAAFTEFAGTLVKQGTLASVEEYLSTVPTGGFFLHFLPFLQGMLYVGNTTPLADEEINLIQSVADTFSTAYARYEDFNKLEAAKQQVDKTLAELKQAQQQLVQSEKMASLGELTAGIAHEIQNPLNFVNNFSEVNKELISEMKKELDEGNFQEANLIANSIEENEQKILHHGKRADAIVKGMLQHTRVSTGQKESTDINALCDEYLRLSYHGLRAKDKTFNATIKTNFDETIGNVNLVARDIGRVLLNLFNNAFYAVKSSNTPKGENYEPTVTVTTQGTVLGIEIRVKDNGIGISQKIVDKIFQPFFTTKPTGQGTGLGLSLSYDIIKAHSGEIKVKSKEGEGAEFIIQLPLVK
jgi:signal transduction histidine kinase